MRRWRRKESVHARIRELCCARHAPEKPLEDGADDLPDVGWERLSNAHGENALVVQHRLHPCQHQVHVLWRRALDGLLDFVAVGPFVLKERPRRHGRAAGGGAQTCEEPVQQADLIVEVGHVHR